MLSLNKYTRIFNDHCAKALTNAKNEYVLKWVGHKIRHSYGVLTAGQRILSIDKNLYKLDDDFKKDLEITCLLHDLGRFYQTDGEIVFKGKDFDHGQESYNRALLDGIEDKRILLAIKYHNKFDLNGLYEDQEYLQSGEKLKKQIEISCKLVRDADKLQNLEYFMYDDGRGLEKFNQAFLVLNDLSEISNEVIDAILHKKYLKFEKSSNQAEMFMQYIGRIYDVNFDGTIHILKNNGMKDFFINKLKLYKVSESIINSIVKVLDESI